MNKRFRWGMAGLGLLMAVAQAAAPERTTSRIYDAQGRLASVDGPRTDVDDVTRLTYDAQGRLATVTDPLGHATSYGAYDMYGHPGRMTDPNGVVSVMTYTPAPGHHPYPSNWPSKRAATKHRCWKRLCSASHPCC